MDCAIGKQTVLTEEMLIKAHQFCLSHFFQFLREIGILILIIVISVVIAKTAIRVWPWWTETAYVILIFASLLSRYVSSQTFLFSLFLIKVREWIPSIGLTISIPKVIPLKLYLRHVSKSFLGYYSRVVWMFWRRICLCLFQENLQRCELGMPF